MNGRQVLVVDPAAGWWRERLTELFPEVRVAAAASFPEAEGHLADADVLVSMGLGLSPETVARMPRLAWMQCLLAGAELAERSLRDRRDVLLTTVRGIHGPQMTELALLHMLAHARGLPTVVANQAAHVWQPPPEQRQLSGKTVTIVGLGTAGRALAPVCRALDMVVRGVTRSAGPVPGVAELYPRERLADAVQGADFVVVLLPGDPDAAGLVDASVLAAMQPGAHLTSLGRPGAIDHGALLSALREGRIAGAGLDALPTEPPAADDPFWDLPNVLLTPHLGGRSDRYAEQALTVVGPNLRRFLAGRTDLRNLVDRSVERWEPETGTVSGLDGSKVTERRGPHDTLGG